MSGIASIFKSDGGVTQNDFKTVFDALSHRSWDGADTVVRDQFALGHQHAYTVPEEVGEQQPITQGDLWITMDGRLDNREELLKRIGATDGPTQESSDAEIALTAYRELGIEFLNYLVGAFALTIWDPSTERLLAARDKTGIRKLYYTELDTGIIVASEIQAILNHPDVSFEINESLIGEFLASNFLTPEETFHANVYPVLPGSFVEVTADGIRTETYWNPWDAELDDTSLDDLDQEFLARFEAAVVSRLRSTELPGILMSGGLDSTAIACIADRYLDRTQETDSKLHSYTLVIDDVDYFEDELERLNAVVEQCNIQSHTVRANDYYALKDLAPFKREARESVVFSPTLLAASKLYEKAADADRTVLLGGFSGNLLDGNRFSYYDLLRDGRILTFTRHARTAPFPLRKILFWFVLVPASDHIANFVRKRNDSFSSTIPQWIAPDFVDRCQLHDRLSADVNAEFDSVSKELIYKLQFQTYRRFEEASQRRVALQSGIDLRTPYLDSRLIEFLFSIPSYELYQAGESKALFRRSLDGIVPDTVLSQSATVHFNPIVDIGVREEQREFIEELLTNSTLSELGIVDNHEFSRLVRSYLEEGEGMDTRPFWELITLELWLRQWT